MNFNLFLKNLLPFFKGGGKDNVAILPGQFLLPFLSTFHSVIIHIERARFIQTGGKDMSGTLATKCFLSYRNDKGPDSPTDMHSREKN